MKIDKEKTATIDTIISSGTLFEGTLSSKEGIRIEGIVRGRIDCDASLVIGTTGKVDAEIVAESLLIAGEVTGSTITAKKHLEITASGKVYGDISTAKILIGQGAVFEGKCQMISQSDVSDPSDPIPLPAPPGTPCSDPTL
jgi:cytoskeletal protein CcmA (bactofilin family)